MRMLLLPAALMLLCGAAPPARAATKLQLRNIHVDWDPNGNLWHLTDKVCNLSDGPSGTVLYEFQLFSGDPRSTEPIRIGRVHSAEVIQSRHCRFHRNVAVKVHTQQVPPGEYKIGLWIGDWNGSSYEGSLKYVLSRTFIRSNGS